MIFVDTNVLMYAVGRAHPLRTEAQAFFEDVVRRGRQDLCTSAEVMQELLHAYIPVERWETLDAAFTLVESCVPTVWPIEMEDVQTARLLADHHAGLGARDLLHIAICRHHSVAEIKTFDRGLAAAFQR